MWIKATESKAAVTQDLNINPKTVNKAIRQFDKSMGPLTTSQPVGHPKRVRASKGCPSLD